MKSWVKILFWIISSTVISVYLVLNLHINSDIEQFMPSVNKNSQLQALMSEVKNGPATTTLMIRLSGESAVALAELSTRLSQILRANNEVFSDVRNSNKAIDSSIFNSIFGYRYLLGEQQNWDTTTLRDNFTQRQVELRYGAGILVSKFFTSDPQLVFIKYLQQIIDVKGPTLKHGVWFDTKLKSALIIVQVNTESLNLDVMQQAINTIKQNFTSLVSPLSSAQIEIAGPGTIAVKTRAMIEKEIMHLSLFITALLIIVFVFAYRSLYLLLLAAIPLLSAIIVALAVTQVMFQEVHGIVLAFGITLLGVCLDYPLHLFSHIRREEKIIFSLNRIWSTLLFGGISSIVAYLALLNSGFDGLSQLAVFAASGLSVALIVTRYLLPSLVSPDKVNIRLFTYIPNLNQKQKIALVVVLLSLPTVLIMQTTTFWEKSVDAINPVPNVMRESDRALRHDLNIPEISHVFLLLDKKMEEVLQASEKIKQQLNELKTLNIIDSIWSPTQILPSMQSQQQRQKTLPTKQQLTNNLEVALTGLPFRPASFEPWIDSVQASHKLNPLDYKIISSTPLATILRQGLFQYGDLWVSIIRISGVQSQEKLNTWLNFHPEVKTHHVEIKQALGQLLNKYQTSTFERFIWVVMLLSIIILFWSRNIKKAVKILLSVSIGILSGLAMPLFLGFAINIFHILALLLVLGMGLDYSLFFNRKIKDSLEQQQTFHAISISAVTTSTAFSVLAFSSVPVMAAMGQTVATGVIMCFISAWLLTSNVQTLNQ